MGLSAPFPSDYERGFLAGKKFMGQLGIMKTAMDKMAFKHDYRDFHSPEELDYFKGYTAAQHTSFCVFEWYEPDTVFGYMRDVIIKVSPTSFPHIKPVDFRSKTHAQAYMLNLSTDHTKAVEGWHLFSYPMCRDGAKLVCFTLFLVLRSNFSPALENTMAVPLDQVRDMERGKPAVQAFLDRIEISIVRPCMEKAFAMLLANHLVPNDDTQPTCASCGKEGARMRCTGCGGKTVYCDKECQLADWKTHKKECSGRRAVNKKE